MELIRQKNVGATVVFPMVDSNGNLLSGAEGLDSEILAFSDDTPPVGFVDCINEAVEIGSSGLYYLALTQSEMNNDYIIIQIKTSTNGGKTQVILIRTVIGQPSKIATIGDVTVYVGQ